MGKKYLKEEIIKKLEASKSEMGQFYSEDFLNYISETSEKVGRCPGRKRSGTAGLLIEGLRHALAGTLLVSSHLQLALVAAEHPLEELEPQEGHAQRCQNPPPAPVRDRIDLQPLQQHQQRATPDHPHRRHPIASNYSDRKSVV